MGQSSADVEREIDLLRHETSLLVEELESRAKHVMDPARNPRVLAGAAVAVLGGFGTIVYMLSRRRTTEVPLRGWNPLRRRIDRLVNKASERRSNGMAKRVLWSMFAAGMVAIAALLAKRLSAQLWEATLHERPPEKVA